MGSELIFFLRSDWHRHNLKLKMKGLPLIKSEADFLTIPFDELDL